MKRTKEIIDILNREPIVDSLKNIIDNLDCSENNRSFSLNGDWGCGKSFILELLEDEYNDDKNTIFIKFNAWSNNYYEEPLIAIITTIIDQLNDYYDNTVKGLTKQVLRNSISSLWQIAKSLGKSTAILLGQSKINDIGAEFKSCAKKVKDNVTRKMLDNEIDNFTSLKKALKGIRGCLTKLKKKIIFIVDELDRCLPDYSIKILERTHHIFVGLPNTISIYCVDRKQLKQLVQNFYGAELDIGKYMEKFIEFSYDIPIGSFNDKFSEIFSNYLNNFDTSDSQMLSNFISYIDFLMKEIDIRKRIQIIKKAELLHKLIVKDKCDLSIAYFELVCLVILDFYKKQSGGFLINHISPNNFFISTGHAKDCIDKLFSGVRTFTYSADGPYRDGINISDLNQTNSIVFLYFRRISRDDIFCGTGLSDKQKTEQIISQLKSNCEKTKAFYENMNLIK